MNGNRVACFSLIGDYDGNKEIAIHNPILHVILTASGAVIREWALGCIVP